MKGMNAVLGWLLMLAVLAVPSFLFYNWWMKNKQQTAAETIQSASPATSVFPPADPPRSASPADKQPLAAASAPTFAVTAAAATVGPAAMPAPAQAQPPAAVSAAAPVPVATAPVRQAAASTPAPAQPAAVSTSGVQASWYHPKSTRDPMLSPEDYQRIRESEEQRLEAERDRLTREHQHAKDSGIESKLRLQGIVGTAALINGEMYTAGQTVNGAKILKVGADYIIGEYKGKKFKKTI